MMRLINYTNSYVVLVALSTFVIDLSSSSVSSTVEHRLVINRTQLSAEPLRLGRRLIDALDINKCGKVMDGGWWSSTQAYCNQTVKSSVRDRISGGSVVQPKRFPSYVKTTAYLNKFLFGPLTCGGTIISEDLILTAAHCIRPDLGFGVKIKSIAIEAFEENGRSQMRFAKTFCANPYFKFLKLDEGTYARNDLALIQTYEKFDYNEYVQPACLNHHSIHRTDIECYAVGRGHYDNKNLISNVTKYLPVRRGCGTDKQEKNSYADIERLAKGSTCYSSADGGKIGNACPGDSGGPLYCMDNCGNGLRQYVVGAASFVLRMSTLKPIEICSDSGTDKQASYYTDLSKMPRMVDAMLDGCNVDG